MQWSGVSRGWRNSILSGGFRGSEGEGGRVGAGLPHVSKLDIKFDLADKGVRVWLPW